VVGRFEMFSKFSPILLDSKLTRGKLLILFSIHKTYLYVRLEFVQLIRIFWRSMSGRIGLQHGTDKILL
jgi:hypothetical protein